jgi:hypothetical protein
MAMIIKIMLFLRSLAYAPIAISRNVARLKALAEER